MSLVDLFRQTVLLHNGGSTLHCAASIRTPRQPLGIRGGPTTTSTPVTRCRMNSGRRSREARRAHQASEQSPTTKPGVGTLAKAMDGDSTVRDNRGLTGRSPGSLAWLLTSFVTSRVMTSCCLGTFRPWECAQRVACAVGVQRCDAGSDEHGTGARTPASLLARCSNAVAGASRVGCGSWKPKVTALFHIGEQRSHFGSREPLRPAMSA